MKQFTLKGTSGYSINEIINQIKEGACFITYGYCISIIALTFRPISTPYFILKNESKNKFQLKYNILSLIFGWWGIPWGPIYTVDMIKINKKGGVDVTDDVIAKINSKFFDVNFDEVLKEDLTIDYYDRDLSS